MNLSSSPSSNSSMKFFISSSLVHDLFPLCSALNALNFLYNIFYFELLAYSASNLLTFDLKVFRFWTEYYFDNFGCFWNCDHEFWNFWNRDLIICSSDSGISKRILACCSGIMWCFFFFFFLLFSTTRNVCSDIVPVSSVTVAVEFFSSSGLVEDIGASSFWDSSLSSSSICLFVEVEIDAVLQNMGVPTHLHLLLLFQIEFGAHFCKFSILNSDNLALAPFFRCTILGELMMSFVYWLKLNCISSWFSFDSSSWFYYNKLKFRPKACVPLWFWLYCARLWSWYSYIFMFEL